MCPVPKIKCLRVCCVTDDVVQPPACACFQMGCSSDTVGCVLCMLCQMWCVTKMCQRGVLCIKWPVDVQNVVCLCLCGVYCACVMCSVPIQTCVLCNVRVSVHVGCVTVACGCVCIDRAWCVCAKFLKKQCTMICTSLWTTSGVSVVSCGVSVSVVCWKDVHL